MTSLDGFLPGSFCFGRALGVVMPFLATCFLGARFRAVSLLALDYAFIKDFNVAFMPAWAIDTAFCKSSRIFFAAIPHHAIAESH